MDRDKQIEFMDGAEKRHQDAVARLLSNHDVMAILRQYDHEAFPQQAAKRA